MIGVPCATNDETRDRDRRQRQRDRSIGWLVILGIARVLGVGKMMRGATVWKAVSYGGNRFEAPTGGSPDSILEHHEGSL